MEKEEFDHVLELFGKEKSEGFKWGVGSVGRWICKFGAPHFCLKFSPNPLKQVFSHKLGEKWGAPNLQIQRPTDPTPHSKPSEKKPININIFGRTVSGTNRNRPWDKWDPSPGQNGTRPWDKPAFSW